MEDMFGGVTNEGKIVRLAPLFISLIFVAIALGTMPGTIGHKTKYVRKDDLTTELELKHISIPVSLLSFTLLLLIFGIVVNINAVNDFLRNTNE